MMSLCIDCHMPNQKCNAIQINTAAKRAVLHFRSHRIGVYPAVAATLLQSSKQR